MLFTLEALKARHGDSLLLHYGDPGDPSLIVIDGGPAGVYRSSLRPRLEELKAKRTPGDSLPIELLMVSHIDDDHIKGVLELTADLVELKRDRKPQPWTIYALWHNSFDDILGNHTEDLFQAAGAEVGAAAFGEHVPDDLKVSREAALVLANVPQGRTLRQDAKNLTLELNRPFRDLVLAREEPVDDFGGGLTFRVLGPAPAQARALQQEWDKELKKRGLGEEVRAADFLDKSAYNLSSIVVLAQAGGRRMLLTGDARGDHILESVEAAGLFDRDGKLHVDILKLPHHGSHHNVNLDFFRRITADHYVASGDGKYGNPEPETFRLIFEARGKEAFTIHVTYTPDEFKAEHKTQELLALLEDEANGKRVRFRGKEEKSVVIDLGDDAYEGQ